MVPDRNILWHSWKIDVHTSSGSPLRSFTLDGAKPCEDQGQEKDQDTGHTSGCGFRYADTALLIRTKLPSAIILADKSIHIRSRDAGAAGEDT